MNLILLVMVTLPYFFLRFFNQTAEVYSSFLLIQVIFDVVSLAGAILQLDFVSLF